MGPIFSRTGVLKRRGKGEFPGGLGVRIPDFHCHGLGSIPGRGTKILQAAQRGQKKKKKKRKGPHGCAHTEKRPCEDTARRWLTASRGERPQEQPNLLTP